MNERILNLLSLCMQAKEKGHDCFFNYSPHVQKVSIDVHLPRWVSAKKDDDGEYIIGSDNNVKHLEFYIDNLDAKESEAIISQAEEYLKGLI